MSWLNRKSFKIFLVYLAPPGTFIALLMVLNITDPLNSGPLSILVVFVLIYLLILSVLAVLLHIVTLAIRLINPKIAHKWRRAYYLLSIVSMAPVLLIALNTLGRLDILECFLILVLVGLGCFYILRRTAK